MQIRLLYLLQGDIVRQSMRFTCNYKCNLKLKIALLNIVLKRLSLVGL